MNDDAKESGAEFFEGVLRGVVADTGATGGEKMRAALALSELLGDLSKAKRKELRKIINAGTD